MKYIVLLFNTRIQVTVISQEAFKLDPELCTPISHVWDLDSYQ